MKNYSLFLFTLLFCTHTFCADKKIILPNVKFKNSSNDLISKWITPENKFNQFSFTLSKTGKNQNSPTLENTLQMHGANNIVVISSLKNKEYANCAKKAVYFYVHENKGVINLTGLEYLYEAYLLDKHRVTNVSLEQILNHYKVLLENQKKELPKEIKKETDEKTIQTEPSISKSSKLTPFIYMGMGSLLTILCFKLLKKL